MALRLIMRPSKTVCKTSSVASAVWHVAQSCWNQMLPISSSSIFVNKNSFNMTRQRLPLPVMASPCSFSKKKGPIKSLDQNPHQTVTSFGCVGFSMYACGFSVPQTRHFGCLHTRQNQNEFHLKIFWPKSASSVRPT